MQTNNYQIFGFLPTNRKINEPHVLSLVKSIKEIGYLEDYSIIVTEDLKIIDGQHRFEACKRLSLPVFYKINTMAVEPLMKYLNNSQQNWDLKSHINFNAKSGIKCYQELIIFEEKYKFGMSNSILIFSANNIKGPHIRNGKDFIINENALNIAMFLKKCRSHIGFAYHNKFIGAVVAVFTRVPLELIYSKIMPNILLITPQITVTDYLKIFENIINKYQRVIANRIKLNN